MKIEEPRQDGQDDCSVLVRVHYVSLRRNTQWGAAICILQYASQWWRQLRTVLPLLDRHPHAAALDNALARVLRVIAVRVGACQLSLVRCTVHLQRRRSQQLGQTQ